FESGSGLPGARRRARSLGLISKSGGFEGGHPVLVVVEVGDLAVANLDLGVELNGGRGPAALAPSHYVDQGHDVVAILNDFVDIQPVLVPGVEPSVPVPQIRVQKLPLSRRRDRGGRGSRSRRRSAFRSSRAGRVCAIIRA